MSKFSLDKFKELKDQAGEVEGVVESDPYKAALDKEVSPIKEKILTTFAQISPNSDKKSPEEDTGSWLTNVKGKLAKTVDTSLEKYNELKAERERAKLASKSSDGNSLDIEDDLDQSEPSILSEDSTNQSVELKMSQSQSESTLTDQTSSSNISKESQQCRPQSEIFEFDSKDFDKTQPQDIPTTPTTDTPTKSKKKFAIPSLFSRTSTPNVVAGSPGKEDLNKIETPKRTVRSLFSSYVGKNSQPQPDLLSSSPSCSSSVPLLDPFSGLENEKLIISEDQHDAGNESPEVEEGLDAAELSLTPEDLSHEDDGNTVTTAPGDIKHVPHHHNHYQHQQPHHSPPPALPDLVSPVVVAVLAVVNIMLPLWISGFITGLAIASVLTYWLCCFFYPSSSVTNPPQPSSSEPIEIHEAPAVFQSWMNLLPHQFHPYDVDSYEVRNTISVRISVEHHMLKIEYPEWNIPKRLNTDEVIPADIKFLYHSDHVDLTKAKISLLPEGIAGKRMFSKKYPIEVRTNGLSFIESQHPTSLIKSRKLSRSKESINSEDSDVFKDVAGTPTKNSPTNEFPQLKVFYLFARADREKEDIYKCLMDAHHFLTDTVLDVARREDAITEGIDRDAGGRETVRERKYKFNDFMSRVFENQKREAEDASLGFINVFLNRIFYDIHKSEEVKKMLKTRVYNKLLKIKITQWFKSIELTEINMGKTLPKACWVSNLHQDDRGLWVELGVQYDGIASATIETCGLIIGDEIPDSGSAAVQLKALLEETDSALPVKQLDTSDTSRKISSRIVAATNSDEEDSAEEDSDSQELDLPVEHVVGSAGNTAAEVNRAKWWEMVGNSEIVKSSINKLSKSEWFKEKTNKKMTLHLELASLNGVLVLNIPPPPSDRLWYSFKSRPDLGLRIVPYYGGEKLGNDNTFSSRAINKIIDIVVNRLKEEIHKFVLLPNMDDIPIKIMDPFPSTNEVKLNT